MTAEQLEAAARRALAGDAGKEEHLVPCPAQFFRGFPWEVYVCVQASEDGLYFDLCVAINEELFALGPAQCVRCSATFTACQVPGAGERLRHPSISEWGTMQHFVGVECGCADFWELGPQAGWDAAAWAANGLLLEGGRVRVVATLEEP